MMDGQALVSSLKRSIGRGNGGEPDDAELAELLGVNLITIGKWKTQNSVKASTVANMVVKAQAVASNNALKNAIKPVVEFYPIDISPSAQGARCEVFGVSGAGGGKHPYKQGLRTALEKAHGIYIFYDSRGRALYSGKARRTFLWAEMNSVLNRKRTVQSIRRVSHPESRREFKPSGEKLRRIRIESVELHELASYFSAYEVPNVLVDIVESILIRSFANDLLNVRMEKFGGGQQGTGKAG